MNFRRFIAAAALAGTIALPSVALTASPAGAADYHTSSYVQRQFLVQCQELANKYWYYGDIINSTSAWSLEHNAARYNAFLVWRDFTNKGCPSSMLTTR